MSKMNDLPPGFINWIESYLTDRNQMVYLKGFKSDIKSVTSGVPQGSVMGPYLFGLFSSDFTLDKGHLVKYADDTTVLLPIFKGNIEDGYQSIHKTISLLQAWSTKNHIALNVNKSRILFISNSQPRQNIHPTEFLSIKTVSNIKLLGVTFNQNLTFNEHFTNILTKANQRLYILRMLKRIMTKKELWNIYESLIRSILEYAAPMFVKLLKYLIKKLERNQKRAHNIICGYENIHVNASLRI